MIADDTSLSKMYSKYIEGLMWVYFLADIIWQKEEGTKNEIFRAKLTEKTKIRIKA